MPLPHCPACDGTDFKTLIDLGEVPRSGSLLRHAHDAYSRLHLFHEYCVSCGLIRRGSGTATDADYTHVDRATRQQLPEYADEVLAQLRAGCPDPDGLVVEVGANDGTFLDLVRERGFTRRLGVEPSRALSARAAAGGHVIENVHLTLATAARIRAQHGPAAAVICRHTLEHVPDPRALMAAMRTLLDPAGVLFVEVPCSRTIVEDLHGYELWDEHLHGFDVHSLSVLAVNLGFRVDSLVRRAHRDAMNLLLWSRPGNTLNVVPSESASALPLCRTFSARWHALTAQWQQAAREWPGPVYAMGASHPQTNFLLFSGLGGQVSALIDDDPRKAGGHVPLPDPVPVITTAELNRRAGHSGTLLLTAFGYPDWMRDLGATLRNRGFLCFDPYSRMPSRTALEEPA